MMKRKNQMCKFCDCTKEIKHKRKDGTEIHYSSEAKVNHAVSMYDSDSYVEKEKEFEKDELDNWYDYTGMNSSDEGFCIVDGDMLGCALEGGCTSTVMKIKNCPICNKELKHIEPKFIKDET